jgi:hypothetical protein
VMRGRGEAFAKDPVVIELSDVASLPID